MACTPKHALAGYHGEVHVGGVEQTLGLRVEQIDECCLPGDSVKTPLSEVEEAPVRLAAL